MQFKKFAWVAAALLSATILASCNIGVAAPPTPDVNAIFTSAAETTIAQFSVQQTETAQASPPTALPSPTALPTFTSLPTFALIGSTPFTFDTPGVSTPFATTAPGSGGYSFPVGCNDALFTGDSIFYDNKWHPNPQDGKSELDPGQAFKYSWDFVNNGTCTWDDGYWFAFKTGDSLKGDDFKFIFQKDFTKPGKGISFIIDMKAPFGTGEHKGYWQMRNDQGVWFGSLVWVDIVVKK
jgi:hypothetical protein